MTAPLIVQDTAVLAECRQEVVVMLHDFSFTAPDTRLADLTGQTHSAIHAMARSTENAAPAPMAVGNRMGPMQGMAHRASGKAMGMSMSGMSMDLNDIHYDAFLANDRTLHDPETIQVERSGRVRIRIINRHRRAISGSISAR